MVGRGHRILSIEAENEFRKTLTELWKTRDVLHPVKDFETEVAEKLKFGCVGTKYEMLSRRQIYGYRVKFGLLLQHPRIWRDYGSKKAKAKQTQKHFIERFIAQMHKLPELNKKWQEFDGTYEEFAKQHGIFHDNIEVNKLPSISISN